MSSNLPPGVTENMIPGNRPDDIAFDKLCEELVTAMDAAGFEIEKLTDTQIEGLAQWLWDRDYR